MPLGTPTGSEYQTFTPATTRACAVPSGITDGALLMAYAGLSQDDAATSLSVSPDTWQSTVFAKTSVIGTSAVFWRSWRSGDTTSYTFSKSGSTNNSNLGVVMVQVSGAQSTLAVNPINTDLTAANLNVPCPAVTVPSGFASNALVVRFYHTYYYSSGKVNTDIWTPPSGFTELADQSDDWYSTGAATLSRAAGTEAAANAVAAASQSGAAGRGVSLVVAPAAASTVTNQGALLSVL